ncbi:hypothetical protein MVEN_01277700 [Mycena venus]|uniref:Uncharacterized protein n=1 Tax=Mycena venus TaxID=2733690 RepID=A0A8H7CYR4_9AGAR|nr:hypothetical protein MVEN_01277700 [Mycena venus]
MKTSVGFLIFSIFSLVLSNTSIHVQARVVQPNWSANVQRDAKAGNGLASASWIWAASSNGSSNVAFLKNITTPTGKTASSAVVSITAVQNFTLWVNGQPIGASLAGKGKWKTACVLRAALNASVNTFSVLVTNDTKPAMASPGLLAAIEVSYSDSTNATFVSDSSWLAASTGIPPRFPMPWDFSSFASAVVVAAYGSGPWGQNSVSLPSADPNPLTLQGSTWLWSTKNASSVAAAGSVGFRRTFPTPSGQSAQSATILLTADNNFALYLNGEYVGTPPGVTSGVWQYAQQFSVKLNATMNVFTVIAQNFPTDATGGAAGFIAAIEVFFLDGTSQIIRTDSSWKDSNLISVPMFLSTSDDLLLPSVEQGKMGMKPWGNLLGISDALSAASVPSPPFNTKPQAAPDPPSSSTPSSSSHPSSHPAPVGAIVGAVVGAVVLVAIMATLFIWRCRRRNSRIAASGVTSFTTGGTPPFSEYSSVANSSLATLQPFPVAARSKFHRRDDSVNLPDAPPPSYADAESEPSVSAESGRSIAAVKGGYRSKR